jgi:hypothetical protein
VATVRDLIEDALREIGVLAEGETASAFQAWEGIKRLNRFIERLSLERLTIYQVTRTTWTLTSGDGSYTIGAATGYKSPPQGGDVSAYRPIFINEVRFIDRATDPDTEYPLARLTDDQYAAITLKDQTASFPQAWYYNPTYPNGALILWPAPTAANLHGVLYAPTAMTGFGTGVPNVSGAATILSTTVSLPDGYEEMLVTNLAVLLCPANERQAHPELKVAARDSLAAIKRANQRLSDLSFEPAALIGGGHGRYDIRLG